MANILLAECNEVLARVLVALFTQHGHTVTVAQDGIEVLRLWSESYELLFSDYQLGGMTIVTVLAQLQQEEKAPRRVVVHSLRFSSEESVALYRCQLRQYLPAQSYLLLVSKGTGGEVLLDMVKDALEA